MKELYRKDYVGEFVITKIIIRDGKKEQHREWISSPLSIEHFSTRATCIAEHHAFNDAFYKQVSNNNGGNLGKQRMQVYGIDSVWKKMIPNFLICKDTTMLEEMINTEYTSKSIVYTSASKCLKYPEEFYLIPYNQSFASPALAVWLACFDGHDEVYIVGYDYLNQKVVNSLLTVMQIYRSVKFIHVTTNQSPTVWKKQINFEAMSKDQYVSHCDV